MTTTEKTCFKCLETKPLSEFYRHSRMGDGYLNKCKACTKADVTSHRLENVEKIREYDRKRRKRPERQKVPNEISKARRQAAIILCNSVRDGKVIKDKFCFSCGKEGRLHGHHYDYSRPADVTWLCPSCHKKTHQGVPNF